MEEGPIVSALTLLIDRVTAMYANVTSILNDIKSESYPGQNMNSDSDSYAGNGTSAIILNILN